MTSMSVQQETIGEVHVARAPERTGMIGSVMLVERFVKAKYLHSAELVVALRVRCSRPGAEIVPPLLVELKGDIAPDAVTVGDVIQLPATWTPGRPLSRVTNLTTGATVYSGRPSRLARWRH